jgi:hypothetical protein
MWIWIMGYVDVWREGGMDGYIYGGGEVNRWWVV